MVGQTLERREVEHQVSADSVTAVAVTDSDLLCTMVNDAFCILLESTADQVVGRPITGFKETWFGRAVSQLPFAMIYADNAAATVSVGAPDERRLLLSCSVGHALTNEVRYVLTATALAHTLPSDQLIAYTTQLERSVMAGQHEVDRSREAAIGLRNLLLMSISNRPLDEMLAYVYEQAQRLLGATGMTVMWAPDFTSVMSSLDQLHILYTAGTDVEHSLESLLVPALLTELHEQQAPIFVAAAMLDSQREIAPSLVVPLLVDGEVHGVVVVALATAALSPTAHQDALWLADQVIIAHGADRLQQKARTASALQQRERLAREMHDAAMQSIYSITLFAEAGRRLASLGQIARVQDYLQQLNETAQSALKELRLLLYELQPAVLEQVGLIGALRQRLESVEKRTGMTARLEVDGDIAFPAFVEDGLYRICQEALNNALKHASASDVRVYLGVHDKEVHLEICDNGIGFDAEDTKWMSGEGMTTMHERARLMHAKLFIESAPQKGVCVRVLMSISNWADLSTV